MVRTLCGTDFKYINANLVIKKIEQFILTITNVPVSETIRKPPLVKPKLHFKKKQKIKYGEKRFSIWRIELLAYTLQCGTWFWNHDSEFTKWQQSAMWYVALGWHAMEFAQTFAILEFYIWFRFWPYHRSRHVILHQSAKFYPNRTTISRKNDVVSIFKMAVSAILDFWGPIMGSLKVSRLSK